MKKTSKISFIDWLAQQQHRDDAVGRLAIHVAKDDAFPRKATYLEALAHLVETLAAKHVPALQRASREYREGTERS